MVITTLLDHHTSKLNTPTNSVLEKSKTFNENGRRLPANLYFR